MDTNATTTKAEIVLDAVRALVERREQITPRSVLAEVHRVPRDRPMPRWPAGLAGTLAVLRADGWLREVRPASGSRSALYAPGERLGAEAVAEFGDPAPDFTPGYPSTGEQIGPTWQAMWEAMADGKLHDSADLVDAGRAARGCAFNTARNLLYAAAKAGHIAPEALFDEHTRRWRIWYRRGAS